MTVKLQPALLAVTATLALGLAACSGAEDSGETASDSAEASSESDDSSVSGKVYSLSDGPDICIRQFAEQVSADVNVADFESLFSVGSEIESNDTEPKGQLKVCRVTYQDPDNPKKLLGARMDGKTGKFGEPQPVEISVSGGNASEFDLNNHVVPLSEVNAAALQSFMDEQDATLKGEGGYSDYGWWIIKLDGPGRTNAHELRVTLKGRIASNDVKENGWAGLSIDGKTVTDNYLMPD